MAVSSLSQVSWEEKPFSGFLTIRVTDILLFICLCAEYGHQLSGGFDPILRRFSLVAYAVASAISFCADRERGQSNEGRHAFAIWLFCFFGYAYLSYFWAANPLYLIRKKSYINSAIWVLLVCPFIVTQYRNEREVKRLFSIILWASAYSACVLIAKTPLSAWGNERIGMQIGVDRNEVGMRLAIAAFIAFTNYKWSRSPLFLLLTILCAFVSMLTGSRKAMAVLVLVVVSTELMDSKGIKTLWNILSAVLLIVLLYQLVMNNAVLYNVLGRRVESLIGFIGGNTAEDISARTRDWYAEYAMNMWRERPILGWGYVGFEAEMQRIGWHIITYSHRNYTELLATLGIVGLILFYSLHAVMLSGFIKANPRKSQFAALSISFLAILLFLDYGAVNMTTEGVYIYLAAIYCAYCLYNLSPNWLLVPVSRSGKRNANSIVVE